MAIDVIPKQIVYELIDSTTGNPFARGFADVGGDYGYHIQRWHILTQDRKQAPPWRAVRLQRAGAPWDTIAKAADFTKKVKDLFKVGTDYYVKVNCDQRSNMDSLPRPMPKPKFYATNQVPSQPDIGTSQLRSGGIAVGYVQANYTDKYHSYEYWVLFNGYSADLNPPVELDIIRSAEHYADLFDRKLWNQSATLVSCACTYYDALPAEM